MNVVDIDKGEPQRATNGQQFYTARDLILNKSEKEKKADDVDKHAYCAHQP